jgi:hypothetical protein
MVSKVGPGDTELVFKFGGGLNTRASEDEIGDREAAGGKNFLLDLENRELRNRPPFDLVATAPNGEEIRGGGSFKTTAGTTFMFVQAGDTVYKWDGTSFTNIATVNSTAQLRGHHRTHTWALDDKVIITDLNLAEEVKEWDGTTFQDIAFLSNPSTSFGDFFAKYCVINNERAIFAHVKDSGATNEHMIVGSKGSDYTTISVSDRPSSSLSFDDPWFLLTPDLKPINGLAPFLGTTVFSSDEGQIFKLTGSTAEDFAIDDFFANSYAAGDESLANIGNDVFYGRQGRIESIQGTERFGDVEANDMTRNVSDQVETYTGWTIVYNSRVNRVYAFPTGQSEIWVLNPSMLGGDESPWMRWTTENELAFQPTFVASMLDPSDGLEYTWMGDASGNLYRLEGTGSSGDGGTSDITTEWLTKLHTVGLGARAFDIEGWIKYRKNEAATVTLTMEYAGENVFNESLTIDIPAISNRPVYNGSLYYNDDNYYGSASGRLVRQKFFPKGDATDLQVRVQVTGSTDIEINEIGLRLVVASE